MTIETINKRIAITSKAIEEADNNSVLALLDTQLEELELLKIEMELEKNED